MILALGFPKGGGSVSAPYLTMSNDGSMLIGKNIHDANLTISAQMDVWCYDMAVGVAVRPPNHCVPSLDTNLVHLLQIVIA